MDADALKREHRRRKKGKDGAGGGRGASFDDCAFTEIFSSLSWRSLASFLIPTLLVVCYSCFIKPNPLSAGNNNQCEMSHMRPKYKEIPVPLLQRRRVVATRSALSNNTTSSEDRTEVYHHKYRLLRYLDHFLPLGEIAKPLSPLGSPVLFIHGHLGTYHQVRSLGGAFVSAPKGSSGSSTSKDTRLRLDYYTLDWRGERTAISGDLVMRQAQYVNDAVRAILKLYDGKRTSVMVVGHSYGGMVARAAFLLPGYKPGSITDIITLGTSHFNPPFALDPSTNQLFESANDLWHWSDEDKESATINWNHQPIINIGRHTSDVVDEDVGTAAVVLSATSGETEGEVGGEGTCTGGSVQMKNGQCSMKEVGGTDDSSVSGDEGQASNDSAAAAAAGGNDLAKKEEAVQDGGLVASIWERLMGKSKVEPLLPTIDVKKRQRALLKQVKLNDTVLISISGGERDEFVHISSCDVSSLGHAGEVLSLSTVAMPGIMFPVDHLALVWCKQLVSKVHETLTRLAEHHLRVQEGGQKKENSKTTKGIDTTEETDAQLRLKAAAKGLLGPKSMKAFEKKGVSSFGLDEEKWGAWGSGADLGISFAVQELFRVRSLHLWISAWVIVSVLIVAGIMVAGLAASPPPSSSSSSSSYSSSYSSSSSPSQHELVSVAAVTLPANHLHWAIVRRISKGIPPSKRLRWISAALTLWLLADVLLSEYLQNQIAGQHRLQYLQQQQQQQYQFEHAYGSGGDVDGGEGGYFSFMTSPSLWSAFGYTLLQFALALPRHILSWPFTSTVSAVSEATHLPAIPAMVVLYCLVVTCMLTANALFWLVGVISSRIYAPILSMSYGAMFQFIREKVATLAPVSLQRWCLRRRVAIQCGVAGLVLVLLHVRWRWPLAVSSIRFLRPSFASEVLLVFLALSAAWYALCLSFIFLPAGSLDRYRQRSVQEVTRMSTYQRLLLVMYLPVPALLLGMQSIATSSYLDGYALPTSVAPAYTAPPSTANMLRGIAILLPTVWTMLLARFGRPFPMPDSIRDYMLEEWRRVSGVHQRIERDAAADMNGSSGSKNNNEKSKASGSGAGGGDDSGWGSFVGRKAAAAAAAVVGGVAGGAGGVTHGECTSCFHDDGGPGAVFVETTKSNDEEVVKIGGGSGKGGANGGSDADGGGGGGVAANGVGGGHGGGSGVLIGPAFRVVACDCPTRYPQDRRLHCEFCCCDCKDCPGGHPFSRSQAAFASSPAGGGKDGKKAASSGYSSSSSRGGSAAAPPTGPGPLLPLLGYLGVVFGGVYVLADASWSGLVLAALGSGLAWYHYAYSDSNRPMF